jgi:hypothetical protein
MISFMKGTGVEVLINDAFLNTYFFFFLFRFFLFIKLSVVMGIGWVVEVVSVPFSYSEAAIEVWTITDAVNALTGVFVFFIFTFRRRTFEGLRRYLCPSARACDAVCGRCCRSLSVQSSRLGSLTRTWTNKLGGRAKQFDLSPSDTGAGQATSTTCQARQRNLNLLDVTNLPWSTLIAEAYSDHPTCVV